MPDTMRAVVLDGPGPAEALTVRDLPIPVPEPGQVLIRVRAFGLNRSELHTRLGHASEVVFPRVIGIEATGEVVAAPGGELAPGQKVVAMMGGMGRTFDGGYAEHTVVPVQQVVPFESDLDWGTVGAVPEMLQTAYGAITVGADLQPGQHFLVRGGTTSVGLTAVQLAKRMGVTVLATTRRADRLELLSRAGVDHPLVDDGDLARQVRAIVPDGVHSVLDFLGAPSLRDSLAATRVHGTVVSAGSLTNEWIVKDFYPGDYIPNGVRLTSYGGDASDLPPSVLQDFLDAVAAGEATVPIDTVYDGIEHVVEAHRRMEANQATGKLVVLP